ncbi:MAG: hypothetical protein ACM3PU_17180, partial [Gemmatimonadota bacterium]
MSRNGSHWIMVANARRAMLYSRSPEDDAIRLSLEARLPCSSHNWEEERLAADFASTLENAHARGEFGRLTLVAP